MRELGRLWIQTFADLGCNGGGERIGNGGLTAVPSPPPDAPRGRKAGMLDTLTQDLFFAARTLRRAPAFAIAVIATIALGIGANTAIFTVVSSVLLEPLPYRDADRLVMVWSRWAAFDKTWLSEAEIVDYRRESRAIEEIGPLNADIVLEVQNKKEAGLGKPLPAGIVRVYQLEADSAPVFAGESAMKHTAEGETVVAVGHGGPRPEVVLHRRAHGGSRSTSNP